MTMDWTSNCFPKIVHTSCATTTSGLRQQDGEKISLFANTRGEADKDHSLEEGDALLVETILVERKTSVENGTSRDQWQPEISGTTGEIRDKEAGMERCDEHYPRDRVAGRMKESIVA